MLGLLLLRFSLIFFFFWFLINGLFTATKCILDIGLIMQECLPEGILSVHFNPCYRLCDVFEHSQGQEQKHLVHVLCVCERECERVRRCVYVYGEQYANKTLGKKTLKALSKNL